MIVCPNCNHPNPEGAQACEACYTPLPATTSCPNCGAPVQTDGRFCGQCGFNLLSSTVTTPDASVGTDFSTVPDLLSPDLVVEPEPLMSSSSLPSSPAVPVTQVTKSASSAQVGVDPNQSQPAPQPLAISSKTQLQQHKAQLLHVQTNTLIELPQNLSLIHIGKPNDRIPPDVDVAGFPNSEIVSRIHADIRIEGDAHYIEDVGSSNGTYINNMPLLPGNRHRLRVGDRISLGKGDLVTFLFQIS